MYNYINLCRIIYTVTGQQQVRLVSQTELTDWVRLVRSVLILLSLFAASVIFIAVIWAFFWVSCFAMDSCYNAQFMELL